MRLQLGELVFDGEARQLSRGARPIHLEPKAFELLRLLFERRPAAVSKASIRDRLWADTFVSESSLTTLVAQLRQALGPESARLRTVRGFGYALDGEASERGAAAGSAGSGAVAGPCLVWQERVIALEQGENVLGRDPGAQVVVDVPGVSRRHARIVVSGARATLEDLGSKNGTCLGKRKIERPTALEDRDQLALGRTILLYRCPRRLASTKTEVP